MSDSSSSLFRRIGCAVYRRCQIGQQVARVQGRIGRQAGICGTVEPAYRTVAWTKSGERGEARIAESLRHRVPEFEAAFERMLRVSPAHIIADDVHRTDV